MEIVVREVSGLPLVRRACEMTMHGQTSKVTLEQMYRAEHSPIRCRMFWIELLGIPTFVSVHLVRHKHGVEHFVQSNRDDRSPNKKVDRDTLVNHGMLINAQALINISRKRLCLNAHGKTVGVWSRLRKAIREVDAELARFMVPECVYRNGMCPEIRECDPGPTAILQGYARGATDVRGTCDNCLLKGDFLHCGLTQEGAKWCIKWEPIADGGSQV